MFKERAAAWDNSWPPVRQRFSTKALTLRDTHSHTHTHTHTMFPQHSSCACTNVKLPALSPGATAGHGTSGRHVV